MENSSEHIDMNTLARQIAASLPGWTTQPYDGPWLAYLVHADGPKIALRHDRGRVKIMGTWPVARNGEHFYPYSHDADISCAFNRGPQAIAKEIQRRLLPVFLPLWQEQNQKRQQAEEDDKAAQDLVRRLEDVFGLAHRNHDGRGRNEAMRVHYERATFMVHRYGSVKVEISIDDADTVLRLAELVKTFDAGVPPRE